MMDTRTATLWGEGLALLRPMWGTCDDSWTMTDGSSLAGETYDDFSASDLYLDLLHNTFFEDIHPQEVLVPLFFKQRRLLS